LRSTGPLEGQKNDSFTHGKLSSHEQGITVSVRFLGVGDASQDSLGHASIVVENLVDQNQPAGVKDKNRQAGSSLITPAQRLLVDCGPGVIDAFIANYDTLPDAVFITHCHLDHIADFEKLFIKTWFAKKNCLSSNVADTSKFLPKIFVPADIIPLLHQRVGTYPSVLAEGGVNFWEAFQLIPVFNTFEYHGLVYQTFPVKHHGAGSAYSLYLPDAFFYSGDTRPIPDLLEHKISKDTSIFHDCSLVGNPSHTGIDDILREYSPEIIERLHVYHYNHRDEQKEFLKSGLRVIEPDQVFDFYHIQSKFYI